MPEDLFTARSGATEGPGTAAGEMRELTHPDVVLVHPGLPAETVRALLPALWPDGDLAKSPPGYRERSAVFTGLHIFVREDRPDLPAIEDAELPVRTREWVDSLSQRWGFARVFTARDINFWGFLRDRLAVRITQMMRERHVLEQLAGDGQLVVLAAGIDPARRMLLRSLSELLQQRIRPEIAFAAVPVSPPGETVAERRFRKLFFLLQDAWHGMRFVAEDLLLRRPKVLLVSEWRGWRRRHRTDRGWARTDVHLESVWHEGRKRPLRLYYRTDSYHPDVGAMTGGRLAPTYLRHFLFLLAQTSRGFLETRSIQRSWQRLRNNEEFRTSLVFDDLPVADIIVDWLDQWVAESLPTYVRDTRREDHFLRGIRPNVILMTAELDENRPLLAAAERIGIPTVVVQLHPFQHWQDAYLAPPPGQLRSMCLPKRLCVFTPEIKAQLVERGAFEPSQVAVTGDPRLEAQAADERQPAKLRLRRRWGVENSQKVLAVAADARERTEVLEWIDHAIAKRQDAFVLFRLPVASTEERQLYRQSAAAHGLRWFHLATPAEFAEAYEEMDLLATTRLPEIAEGALRGIPVVHMHFAPPAGFDPCADQEICTAVSADSLRDAVLRVLEGEAPPRASGEARDAFLASVFGKHRGWDAARKVLDATASLLGRDG